MRTIISCKRINKTPLRYVSAGCVAPIQLDRALIVSKVTRYEVEQHRHPNLNETRLETMLRQRGSDFESLVDRHMRHKTYERYIVDVFNKMGITTRTVNRLDYLEDSMEWCDVVFPVGGDGTFLFAASCVADSEKPVIGFTSDPLSSEGFLCLPKRYSNRAEEVLCKLLKGEFKWMFRSRIRVKLHGVYVQDTPKSLHEFNTHRIRTPITNNVLQEVNVRFSRLPFDRKNFPNTCNEKFGKWSILPVLALNEVFVGENKSEQVSYFELRTSPDDIVSKVKSSGICVSTGTGSTCWHLSMNRITDSNTKLILKCAGITSDFSEITKRYNDSLIFRPDDPRMCYTVRELISEGTWPQPAGLAARGFSKSLWIRSHCLDGGLVIDGRVIYPFSGGTVAVLEIHPQDTLCTVDMT